jgi:hypothetical protein
MVLLRKLLDKASVFVCVRLVLYALVQQPSSQVANLCLGAGGWRMRWQRLFDDLEAQFDAAQAAELSGEVAERSRREVALARLVDRLRAAEGAPLVVTIPGAGAVRGRLLDAGVDWLLLEESGPREVLVPLPAVLGVTGLGSRTAAPDASPVRKRLDLRWALRGLARSRTGVALGLVDGSLVTGTLDRVAADHLDLAEHGLGEARRAGAVRQVRLVPLTALALVRSG